MRISPGWRSANKKRGEIFRQHERAAQKSLVTISKPKKRRHRKLEPRIQTTAERYDLRREVADRDRWRCWLCWLPIDPECPVDIDLYGTLDHMLPRSEGGSNEIYNLRFAHKICNNTRETLPVEDLDKLRDRLVRKVVSRWKRLPYGVRDRWLKKVVELDATVTKLLERDRR